MHVKVLLTLFAVCLVYLLLGAMGFHYIERPREQSREKELQRLIVHFMSQYSCLDPKNLTDFFSNMINAYKAGYSIDSNGTVIVPAPKWDYPNSIFFCMTVITTIGYGNLSPSTQAGQAFCCAYALIGIPMLAILLGGIAEKIKGVKERVTNWACWRNKGRLPGIATSVIYYVLGILFFFFVPAIVYMSTEGWAFGEGLYYSFITLSTIGFGDYVAGQSTSSQMIYRISLALWIYLGMVFMSSVIANVQDHMESGAKRAVTKVAEHLPNHSEIGAAEMQPDPFASSEQDGAFERPEKDVNGRKPIEDIQLDTLP